MRMYTMLIRAIFIPRSYTMTGSVNQKQERAHEPSTQHFALNVHNETDLMAKYLISKSRCNTKMLKHLKWCLALQCSDLSNTFCRFKCGLLCRKFGTQRAQLHLKQHNVSFDNIKGCIHEDVYLITVKKPIRIECGRTRRDYFIFCDLIFSRKKWGGIPQLLKEKKSYKNKHMQDNSIIPIGEDTTDYTKWQDIKV